MKKKLLYGLCGLVLAGGSYATASYYNDGADSKVEAQVVKDVASSEEETIEMIISTTEAIEVVLGNGSDSEDVTVTIGSIDKPGIKNDEVTVVASTEATTEVKPEPSNTTEVPNTYPEDEGIHPTPDSVGPGGHPLTTEEPITETPTTERPTTEQPTTEEPRQEKVWVPDEYERVWVVDVPAWTEEIPVYEDHEAAQCVQCGHIMYTQSEVESHMDVVHCWQYRNYPYSIQVGTETIYHEEEGHYENKLVREGHWEYR